MECLLAAHEWSIGCHEHVETWVGNEDSWEIVNVHVETTVETKGGSEGGYNLCNQSVKVGVGWTLNVETCAAYVVKSLVIKVEGEVESTQGGSVWRVQRCMALQRQLRPEEKE